MARRIALLVASVASLALLLGACAHRVASGPDREGSPALTAALVGTWRPAEIAGYVPPAAYPNAFRDATITFDHRQMLSGSDGCNTFRVSYRVTASGELRVGEGSETQVGCANVPNDRVVSAANRVLVHADSLTFVDSHGQLLGRYERVEGAG